MSPSLQLAAVLVVCLPATALVSPYLAPPSSWRTSLFPPRDSRVTNGFSSQSYSRGTPPELRATGGSSVWDEDKLNAARENLINSNGFLELVQRLDHGMHRHEGHSKFDSAPEISISDMNEDGIYQTSPPDSKSLEHELPAKAASSTEGERLQEHKKQASPPLKQLNLWPRNAEKLESLRSTALESDRARQIAGKLRAGNGSSSRTPTKLGSAGSSVHANEERITPHASKASSTNREAPKDSTTEETGGMRKGRAAGRPRLRWIRGVATALTNVGRRARGRAPRVAVTKDVKNESVS